MTVLLSICVAVIFAVSVYLLTSRDLKRVAMGLFLFSHAAHMGIIAMSGQPLLSLGGETVRKASPILGTSALGLHVDPLPQALILTSIVISFAVTGFLLALLVAQHRRVRSMDVTELREEDRPEMPDDFATAEAA